MAVVGAWARVDTADQREARRALGALPGVETFDLGDPGKVGLLIEADQLEAAHTILTRDVPAVRGVLCAWPVSVHLDDDEEIDASGTVIPIEASTARSSR